MPDAKKNSASCAKFIVHCNGPCFGINIWLDIGSGDADLYALDTSWPIVSHPPLCHNCWFFCQSIKSAREHRAGARDECMQLHTTKEEIYVLVYAYSDYGNVNITFEDKHHVIGDVEELAECRPETIAAVQGTFVNI